MDFTKIDAITEEMAAQLAEELCDLIKDLQTLSERMADLIKDANPLAIGPVDLGLVISLNTRETNIVSATLGTKDGIKQALEAITKTVKEKTK